MTPDAHVLLVRHAEPVDTHRCHGAHSDPGLSRLGARQAEGVALRVRVLANELGPVRRLVCSPAARAIATMVPLAEGLRRAPTTDERWRERDFGTWEGRAWSELWAEAPEAVTHDAAAYAAWTPPEGETPDAVDARVGPALVDALAGRGTTVVVTHAGAIRAAVATALAIPAVASLRIDVPHGRITVLARTEDAVTLTRVGA